MMDIKKMITPYNHGVGTIDRITHIVLHYVGALGSAKSNCKFFMTNGRGASAHYFVNHDGQVWQSVEDKDIAWHCTNRNKQCNNNNAIGIEMCCSKDANGRWFIPDATVKAAIELTKELMAKYNVPIENVWRHYDCYGKLCPEPFVRDPKLWEDFLNALGNNEPKTYEVGWYKDTIGWWYAKSETEYAKSEWMDINGHTYYFDDRGYMVTGLQNIGGEMYYFATAELSKDFEGALMCLKTTD